MDGLFQAAHLRVRARGYRNEANFIAMIYLVGSPVVLRRFMWIWPIPHEPEKRLASRREHSFHRQL